MTPCIDDGPEFVSGVIRGDHYISPLEFDVSFIMSNQKYHFLTPYPFIPHPAKFPVIVLDIVYKVTNGCNPLGS
jgi:hypothetical protein